MSDREQHMGDAQDFAQKQSLRTDSPVRRELDAIIKRDQETSRMWFEGPKSFTAQAARDRRTLLYLLGERSDG